ncbi:MAG: sulfatase-like hydrolase/transferase, partial [Proteobacteria bacterium]|nr:sulfatase-like hydrolase/transferase [Pseudomonadota bacterium]
SGNTVAPRPIAAQGARPPHRNIVYFALILLALQITSGCRQKTDEASVSAQTVSQQIPDKAAIDFAPLGSTEWHVYFDGLGFDIGSPQGQKYLEARGGWLAPEFISPELAERDRLPWARGRYVRWLADSQATFHFPWFIDPDDDKIAVHLALRPKVNTSAAIRFYRPAADGKEAWSEPTEIALRPGWTQYTVEIPVSQLAPHGMQLMRVSFAGTYFEGDNRVSARFVRVGLGRDRGSRGAGDIPPQTARHLPQTWRVLEDAREGWGLASGDALEHYAIVPQGGSLAFSLAPGSYLLDEAMVEVYAMTDEDPHAVTLLALPIEAGEPWREVVVPLEVYSGRAVRLGLRVWRETEGVFDAGDSPQPLAYVAQARMTRDTFEVSQTVQEALGQDLRQIVVLAIDNLRADRLFVADRRRATPQLTQLAARGLSGLAMADALANSAASASFLTSLPASVHGIIDDTAHLRTSLTTLGEAFGALGWKTYFLTGSAHIDAARGFAQGFDVQRRLHREGLASPGEALEALAEAMAQTEGNGLFYLHLATMRLPHRGRGEAFAQWAVPGYSGGVTPQAMQNVAVLRDPTPQDAAQFAAYYDADLALLDEAIGEFAKRLPQDALLVIYGTHGSSLGETTLGYMQSLSPWELIVPYLLFRPNQTLGVQHPALSPVHEISAALLDLAGADRPASVKTIFEPHPTAPLAYGDGLIATATLQDFYRMRREGVDTLLPWRIEDNTAPKDEPQRRITRRALREQITRALSGN